eukprot:Rhum_TRINITY_DN14424_c28_g1::Rhum_TRINITY_DN14424_c28_g1_i1::g.89225::m.89225/K07891/RAB22; Ras-related protein Rab-22
MSADAAPQAEGVEMKIVMVGDIDVGKTSIIARFIRNQYNQSTQPTIGASYMWKECVLNGEKVKYAVWDTAGQEQYHSLVPVYFRSAAAVVLTYDLTSEKSLEATKHWEVQIRQNAPADAIIAIVGNKSDLTEQREVTKEAADEVKNAFEADILTECSAKTADGVFELFESIALLHLQRTAATKSRERRADTFVPGRDETLPPRKPPCKC